MTRLPKSPRQNGTGEVWADAAWKLKGRRKAENEKQRFDSGHRRGLNLCYELQNGH
ncbi:MAG: hypothetical protein LBF16_03190 [Pseudomonadales bacterium]|jgi:hypothetical protein|nr:hypothetical protein [Pseudomonadales bacterium]